MAVELNNQEQVEDGRRRETAKLNAGLRGNFLYVRVCCVAAKVKEALNAAKANDRTRVYTLITLMIVHAIAMRSIQIYAVSSRNCFGATPTIRRKTLVK